MSAKKDFLKLSDLSKSELTALLKRALFIKKNDHRSRSLQGKMLGLIFEKESTRTRISFEVAMQRLGGGVTYLNQQTSQLSRGESYADTARVLSRYLDGLVLRTFSQEGLDEVAAHSKVPVINGLTDLHHPCQVLADIMTILEQFGSLNKMIVAYVGDGNNMTNTWIEAAMILGFKLQVGCPKKYLPDAGLMTAAKTFKNIEIGSDPVKAVTGAHAINTDTWFSMGQKVSSEKRKAFSQFQVNKALLKKARPEAIVLHCLPAHRGEEITDEVLDGPHSVVFDEAENRLYVQMAILEKYLGPK
ncbi:MAG: hypothetical protein ACD_73C00134G0002 [uncultured bacterium]|nr:MAG: hypothetical protein ACD_73C00134G0002 [uncultured bacterium]